MHNQRSCANRMPWTAACCCSVVDTDEDADLRNEQILRPYGVAGEYGSFGGIAHATFGVQVYENGDLLSIVVTVGGSHGTHVASIAAGYSANEPTRNGIVPGARIVSIKLGDIRTRGSSYGTATRALALAAQHRVDIVNASWGGRSTFQDGRNRNSLVYDMLTERYNILSVLSAGNNGPALGTADSAGAEASRVLGVGSYMSSEMGQVLYNTMTQSADAAQQFSSRGPTKDGDFGIDLMAPGAAYASVSELENKSNFPLSTTEISQLPKK